ncbi:MAG: hypothetical protein Q7V57_02510 [Actinomycetota bacterium]|nr:hypothetical protein [Actinomycetota bacterium]
MDQKDRDHWFVAGVVVAGLGCWLTYCAVQPHDFWNSADSGNATTIFGWNAPGVPEDDASAVPDRIWIVMVGWSILSLSAGWLRPRSWLTIGVYTVLPTWIIYLPTAPRSDDGLWGVGVLVVPFTIVGFAAAAWFAGKLRCASATVRHPAQTLR